jgi:hypothetical protein
MHRIDTQVSRPPRPAPAGVARQCLRAWALSADKPSGAAGTAHSHAIGTVGPLRFPLCAHSSPRQNRDTPAAKASASPARSAYCEPYPPPPAKPRLRLYSAAQSNIGGTAWPPNLLAAQIHRDQTRDLGPAQARRLLQVAPHQPPPASLQCLVTLLAQSQIHPVVHLVPIPPTESQIIAGLQKRPDLLQTQPLSCLHFDDQCPAWRNAPSPGSSCMRINSTVQAHLA